MITHELFKIVDKLQKEKAKLEEKANAIRKPMAMKKKKRKLTTK